MFAPAVSVLALGVALAALLGRGGATDGTLAAAGAAPSGARPAADRGEARAPRTALRERVASAPEGASAPAAAATLLPELEVLVVDDRGAPVPGADVYLSEGRRLGFARRGGRNVTGRIRRRGVTDVRGGFRSELKPRQDGGATRAVVFARLPGRLDSHAAVLECPPGESTRVRLALGGPAAELHGRVLDPDGHPVHQADVRLAPRHDVPVRRRDGALAAAPHLSLRTERDGRFHFGWVEEGPWELRVAAAGFPPLRAELVARPGATGESDLVLERGATVAGTVRCADGTPVAQARVGCLPLSGDGGEVPETRTDGLGRFELTGVPLGSRRVWARTVGAADEVAVADLSLRAGDVASWSPTLAAAEPLSVRVVDGAGAPLVGWRVSLEGVSETLPTDAEGRTLHRVLPAGEVDVVVRAPQAVDVFPAARATAAGPGEVLVSVPDGARFAELRGRVVRGDGRRLAQPALVLSTGAEDAHRYVVDPDTGAFRAERLPRGVYEALLEQRAASGAAEGVPLGRLELEPGETREVEWITERTGAGPGVR